MALLALPLAEEGDPVPIWQQTAGLIDQAYFSPDTRWIAYSSNESGRFEVYLRRFPPHGERWQISTQGGVQPLWGQDGRELYDLGLDGTLFVVPLTFGDIPRPGLPRHLFATPITSPSSIIEDYAVASDGQRFLFKILTREGVAASACSSTGRRSSARTGPAESTRPAPVASPRPTMSAAQDRRHTCRSILRLGEAKAGPRHQFLPPDDGPIIRRAALRAAWLTGEQRGAG